MKDFVIMRMHDAVVRTYELNKLIGNINLASFVDLFSVADLDANPRAAKRSSLTDSIEETLENEPETFQFMSKGILIGARKVDALERGRFRIAFEDPQLEGILDGGHNCLAIARFIIGLSCDDGKELLSRGRRWEDLKEIWDENIDEIEAFKKELPDIRIPVEIIYPGNGDYAEEQFQDKILRINAARNNNAQLTEETKFHKRGFYEEIKANIDPVIAGDVEWKANEGGRIKARDLIALSLIPLSVLPDKLPTRQAAENPQMIFAQKGQCVALFNKLDGDEEVVSSVKGQIVEMKHQGMKSALKLMRDMPRLYDLVYELLPAAYNKTSQRFGGMRCVRIWAGTKKYTENKGFKFNKYLPKPAKTKFYENETKHDYPDGFVYPILFGLTSIMSHDGGKVSWKTDPDEFLRANIAEVLQSYWAIIEGQNFDPAKVGKSKGAYQLAAQVFTSAYNSVLLNKLLSERKKRS
ncbi:AIPR family protein [Methylobacterium sp. D53M]